ncbi:CBS domain-containing protein [Acidihalobacter prosperus]
MKRLEFCPLPPAVGIVRPDFEQLEPVDMRSPALKVMTDLKRSKAVTTQPHVSLDHVHQHMIHNGVRMVLVTDAQGRVVGLLTATDLLGPRPLQVAVEQGLAHDKLRVEHVMTPARNVQVLTYRDVTHADVQEIVYTLRDAARQHALVMEPGEHGQQIRGIFSISQIERQLGVHLEPTHATHNLAELEHEMSAG